MYTHTCTHVAWGKFKVGNIEKLKSKSTLLELMTWLKQTYYKHEKLSPTESVFLFYFEIIMRQNELLINIILVSVYVE